MRILRRGNRNMQTTVCNNCNSEIGYWKEELSIKSWYAKGIKTVKNSLECKVCGNEIKIPLPQITDEEIIDAIYNYINEVYSSLVYRDKTKLFYVVYVDDDIVKYLIIKDGYSIVPNGFVDNINPYIAPLDTYNSIIKINVNKEQLDL